MSDTIPYYWGNGKDGLGGKYDAKLTKEDIIEMQTIDADCNDCRHFQRGKIVKVPGLTFFDGHCLKHNKLTRAYPVQYSGRECFEHRKAI